MEKIHSFIFPLVSLCLPVFFLLHQMLRKDMDILRNRVNRIDLEYISLLKETATKKDVLQCEQRTSERLGNIESKIDQLAIR